MGSFRSVGMPFFVASSNLFIASSISLGAFSKSSCSFFIYSLGFYVILLPRSVDFMNFTPIDRLSLSKSNSILSFFGGINKPNRRFKPSVSSKSFGIVSGL